MEGQEDAGICREGKEMKIAKMLLIASFVFWGALLVGVFTNISSERLFAVGGVAFLLLACSLILASFPESKDE